MITRYALANQNPAANNSSSGFGVARLGRSQALSPAYWDIAKPCVRMSFDAHEGTPRMNDLVGGSA